MAQETVQPISAFEQFMAREIGPALDNAVILLRLLDGRLRETTFYSSPGRCFRA